MYSVFFKMSEIFTNVLFGIAEKIFLKEKPFKEEIKYTLKPIDSGWIFTQTADKYFVEFRGKRLLFRPKFAIIRETDELRKLPVVRGKTEPERVYVSWKEVASDEFFKDVETLFRMVKGERKKVEPSTSKGG